MLTDTDADTLTDADIGSDVRVNARGAMTDADIDGLADADANSGADADASSEVGGDADANDWV